MDSEFTYDELAKLAQRFLAERPVVVLGTGATIPHGLPSMSALADGLLSAITDNPEGWDVFAERLQATKDLEQALHDVPLPQDTVEHLVRATWEIVSSEDICLYKQLLRGEAAFPLSDLFAYLLRTADSHLRVITTNYDRVAEYAANAVGAYASTGVTAGWLQRFVPASVDRERAPSPGFEGLVTILKVHGSLDWFRDPTDDVIAVPLAPAVPDQMKPLVVTPGVSKYREVHKDPFRTVMSAADTALRKATCYVCIGYGFNDEHVQPVLVNRVMKHDIPLVIVTKKLTTQTRSSFLNQPPKHFLFMEEAPTGTMVYTPNNPGGAILDGVWVWKLQNFMSMLTGGRGS
ncbi:SIR2 family protein [Thioalkalivibrio sp. ALJ3]|uniref:SIR2 family protein n=1 Tax=Thioalkalivibrio sp. ALJ3 TaxID=1240557 RepID=UPI0018CA8FE4|nr:SIR2 family protein [Thioalkalivibrio sp. ALJ3]